MDNDQFWQAVKQFKNRPPQQWQQKPSLSGKRRTLEEAATQKSIEESCKRMEMHLRYISQRLNEEVNIEVNLKEEGQAIVTQRMASSSGKRLKTMATKRKEKEPEQSHSSRFLSRKHEKHFKVVQDRRLLMERKVGMIPNFAPQFGEQLLGNDWGKLDPYPAPANIAVVKEFYTNAKKIGDYPAENYLGYVRGHAIRYDPDSINNFLDIVWAGEQCQFALCMEEGADFEDVERVLCIPGGHFQRNRSGSVGTHEGHVGKTRRLRKEGEEHITKVPLSGILPLSGMTSSSGKRLKTMATKRKEKEPEQPHSGRFLSRKHEKHFRVVQDRRLLMERKVGMIPNFAPQFGEQVLGNDWGKLATYPAPANIAVVKEFYTNAKKIGDYPAENYLGYVRGHAIRSEEGEKGNQKRHQKVQKEKPQLPLSGSLPLSGTKELMGDPLRGKMAAEGKNQARALTAKRYFTAERHTYGLGPKFSVILE
ncbi:hypothetical protein LR48_Vigan263s000700 [Vigna angularis]|uniref:Putative plant transposon protein domain-containing protein n=1 Tax=Phaseolus angularis TaxID=3914 RepID=A0A0L9T8G3_PHAAN|nr:hypothetical protein LR48_Vigan263s000700 [Vigna angularis]